ncbi:hypothetical protein MJO28_000107 [Puccinia striiformis f. sp. tritici]|uniref:Uncharacterized protein n=1 Tax=Puccinia striiformis f. sp. tritici TaxID=168172 RepID=A0ACC0EYV8_9BASI|nr:hypothetical protein MJO28_000107 [Puccinia striiformis f. sp. tritici]
MVALLDLAPHYIPTLHKNSAFSHPTFHLVNPQSHTPHNPFNNFTTTHKSHINKSTNNGSNNQLQHNFQPDSQKKQQKKISHQYVFLSLPLQHLERPS